MWWISWKDNQRAMDTIRFGNQAWLQSRNGRVRNVVIMRLRITRRDSPFENANFTGFRNLLLLPLFHHREIEVMCINCQRFVDLLPKPLSDSDVHAEILSCGRRTLKSRFPPRRERSRWALGWAIYDAAEAHPFCPPLAGNSVY